MEFRIRAEDIVLLNDYSEESFDANHTVNFAQELLLEVSARHELNICDISLDKWSIIGGQKSRNNIDFSEVKECVVFNQKYDPNFLITLVKCWMAFRVHEISPERASTTLKYIKVFFRESRFFSTEEQIEDNIKKYMYELSEGNRYRVCCFVINFLDFYSDLDSEGVYTSLLYSIREEAKDPDKGTIRKLPRPKDVMVFSNIVSDFFKKIKKGSPEYLYYFPIYMWWNLTNVIPLRPSEFCYIPREGLVRKKDSFYIKLPRSVDKGKKNPSNPKKVQIIDTILISNILGSEIEEYVQLTTKFGSSKTLISYPSITWSYNHLPKKEGKKYHSALKIEGEVFTNRVLSHLIESFYDDIVIGVYKLNVKNERKKSIKDEFTIIDNISVENQDVYDVSRRIRPGDTRHFAFINLLRQGYHPVEIARLGGHTSLNSQYHYQSHKTFYMDTEVLKLMSQFRFEKVILDKKQENNDQQIISAKSSGDLTRNMMASNASILSSPFGMDSEIRKKFVFNPPKTLGVKSKKLDLGMCTDPMQRCKVEDCVFCDDWRIQLEEYNEKREIINQKVELAHNRLQERMEMLLDLHKYIIENTENLDVDETNIALNRDLVILSKQVNEAFQNVADIQTIKERKGIK